MIEERRKPQHHGFLYHCLFRSTVSFVSAAALVGVCGRSSLAAYSAEA